MRVIKALHYQCYTINEKYSNLFTWNIKHYRNEEKQIGNFYLPFIRF